MLKTIWKIAVFASALALTACGGSSSSTTDISGPWTGTYQLSSSSGTTKVTTGAIGSEGLGYFAANDGYTFVLSSLSGTSPFTATLTGIAPPGQTFANGYSSVGFSVSGTYTQVSSGISMQATFTENDSQGSLSGSFNLTSRSPYTGTSTLANLQGQWSGVYIGSASTSVSLNFGSTGTFAGNDGYGCELSGSLAQEASNSTIYNLYYVTLDSSGSACAGAVDGLAYESSSDVSGQFGGTPGTYLYLAVFGPYSAYIMELKM
ncbi:MAG: hypothetical protein WBR15_11495 [Gammaproteobacteria bacterium]